jgi:hypothetical protein
LDGGTVTEAEIIGGESEVAPLARAGGGAGEGDAISQGDIGGGDGDIACIAAAAGSDVDVTLARDVDCFRSGEGDTAPGSGGAGGGGDEAIIPEEDIEIGITTVGTDN